jgi:hypothetical protein
LSKVITFDITASFERTTWAAERNCCPNRVGSDGLAAR